MNDISLVTAKVPSDLKRAVQIKAKRLGIPMSAIIKDAFNDFLKQKKYSMEEPSQELIDMVNESRKDYERGDYHSFPAGQAANGLRKLLEKDD